MPGRIDTPAPRGQPGKFADTQHGTHAMIVRNTSKLAQCRNTIRRWWARRHTPQGYAMITLALYTLRGTVGHN